jgi:hypothetical protein
MFVDFYRWANGALSDEVGIALDKYVYTDLPDMYPLDVVAVYEALAFDTDTHLRMMAAIGGHNVMRTDPEAAVRVFARLLEDSNPQIVEQARQTLAELDEDRGAAPPRPDTAGDT